MRFSKLVLAAAAAAIAVAATAQEAQEPPAEAEPQRRGLSDLEETVNQLLEEEGEPVSRRATEEAAEQEGPEAEPASDPPPAGQPETAAQEPAPAQEPPAAAQPEPPAEPAPPLTRAELAGVERTAERGRLLIAIARAGILATQDMLSRVSDPEGAGIAGWIAEPAGNAMTVTFYAEADGGPQAVYRASVLGGRVTSREIFLGGDRPALTPLQARMAAARAATDSLDHRACTSQPFNVLVVPPVSSRAPIEVYQLSAPDRAGQVPLGGHYRSSVAQDGGVAETRAFTNACPEIESVAAAAGEAPPPIGITHLLDPAPTEIHVLLAQMAGRPLLVATGEPQRVWLVTSERIAEVRP